MNRLIISVITVSMATFASAQQPGMSQEQVQQMMQQVQKMQACFSRVDQQALMDVGEKAKQMEAQLKSLCRAGKRDQAQTEAVEFGKSLDQDPNLLALRECGKEAQGMLDGMVPPMDFPTSEEALADNHICDNL